MKQLGLWPVVAIWAVFCLGGAFYGFGLGYGGRAFAAALATFAFLLLVTTVTAARGVAERMTVKFGAAGGLLLGVCVFLAYIVYLAGTGTFTVGRAGAIAGLIFMPLALAVSADGAATGTWQDFTTIAGIWVFVKFAPSHWLWPYPGARLAYVMTVLMAVNSALASFLLVRRVKGVGYSIGWGKGWTGYILGSFFVFTLIAIALGTGIHFIAFAPQ